ncbi:protein FAM83D-like [Sceloporus undulatus]|uniref:protein FAM83D-like n=1 Tax=Sceloporus undulatus TaxID=8520 RepID=UPI001C4AD42C|nr:protein FAM83D-like [Sceloporus undulatus]
MANRSQCLEDAPFRAWDPRAPPPPPYSEAQRLALEELVGGGGRAAFVAFLRREKLRPFLSEPEIQGLLRSARPPPPPPPEESLASQERLNASSSLDCSSLTYFPLQSDAEPPVLELGWPGFVSGSFRGLTRVETYFQPSFGESVYPCKEAVRRQIRSAKEVIAIVMDSFTDLDIFGDLQEACRKRLVPVYILLDQAFLTHFMAMCRNLEFCPEQENLMRVRTITGNTYYARSGAKIIGSVHEKFMLVDGVRVTTGSYSFTWTDGKLNSSNLLLLSGQVVEHFDLEFRILYAQSKPIDSKLPSSCRNSGAHEHIANKTTPCKDFTVGNLLRAEFARLSSSPQKLERELLLAKELQGLTQRGNAKHPHLSSEEDLHNAPEALAKPKKTVSLSTQTEPLEEKPMTALFSCATQTSISVATATTQTTTRSRMVGTQTTVLFKTATTQTDQKPAVEVAADQTVPEQRPPDQRVPSKEGSPVSRKSTSTSSSGWSVSSLSSQCSRASSAGSLSSLRSMDYSVNHRGDYFRKQNKEREFHYSVIRCKLNHMVSMLSRRGNIVDNYIACHPMRCNLKPRHQISTSLINLRDFALYTSNDCF